jgi:UDP-glucose 4-epimerase
MRVLITGGAGFIGSHLADALLAKGDEVTILDNLTTGSRANIAHIEDLITVHSGDIRDEALVRSLVKDADLVLHMAAALGVKNIMDNTVESVSINFTGSDVVLKAATEFNKRLLIASTSEIYGKNPQQPLNEESDRVVGAPQKIRWTYSDAKALEEAIAHTLHRTHGLKVTTVRFFNTVGPRQTGQYGMVLPRFVKQALNNEDITIYDDGSQSRVFCHVEDAVRAVLALVADDSTIGDYFNVGGVGETTIKELAERVITRTGSTSKLISIPFDQAYGPGFEDMQRRVPDISKVKAKIGWSPEHTLDSIIDSVADFIKASK